jgi:DNA modification methylase
MAPQKSWFTIDGQLDPIEFDGPSFFRFPMELAEFVIERFSNPDAVVLDPFCGFGTSVVAAQALGRVGIGLEHDEKHFRFAADRVKPPSRVIQGDALRIAHYEFPPADLIFTSPPYTSFREWTDDGFAHYWQDFEAIFVSLQARLKPSGRLVVELSNVRDQDGTIRPVAFHGARILANHYAFVGEYARCNTGEEQAGPGFDHAHLLEYALR